MSGALNRITASLYNTTAAFERIDAMSEAAFNTSSVQAITQELYNYENQIQDIQSQLTKATNRLEEMENETRQVREQASSLENAFDKVAGAVAAIGIGTIIANQVTDAIDYASDLTEVQNVVDTVFGQGSAVNEWSQTTLEAFGLNELSAKQFSGTMGAMLKSSGLAGDTVQDMAMKITELSGDMASFYNLDSEEAFNKIRSGISGETEPLKQLGINMSVANLEAFALSQGIEKAYQEMSQAEQVTLRYNYLLQATSDAQGDFSRTSDSYANQVKLLKENWTAFTGELASNALPILAQGIGILNNAIAFISNNWDVIAPIVAGIAGAIAVITAVALAVKIAAVATSIWNAVLAMNPIVWIVAAVVALIGVIIALCNWIANVTGVAQSGLGVLVGAFAVAGAAIWNTILGIVNFVIGIGVELYNLIAVFANFFANVFNDPVGAIINLFSGMFDFILGIVESAAALIDTVLGTDMAGAVAGFRDKVSSAVSDIVGEQTVVMEKANMSDYMLQGIDYGDAWDAGVDFGDGINTKMSDMFSGGAGVDANQLAIESALGGIGSDTSKIADSVDISNENVEWMRDLAEQEAINRFTTASVKVDMGGVTNNVNQNTDLDGLVAYISDGVGEALQTTAEGVHV